MSAGPRGYVARAMRGLAPWTRRFVAISDYVAGLLRDYGLPPDSVTRIYCATDTEAARESPSTLREDLRLDIATPVVGSTGVWRPNKGFPHFISACEQVQARRAGVRFLLGGRAYGPDVAFATSLWVRGQYLRATGSLDFTGYQADVRRFLSALDVFVLPSDCEPFGLVLIEAMSLGIAVVATAAGGVPEIVADGETGLLVPPRDSEAMANAILRLLDNPFERDRMGRRAREHVRLHFDRRRMVAKYQDLYAELLGEPAGVRGGD